MANFYLLAGLFQGGEQIFASASTQLQALPSPLSTEQSAVLCRLWWLAQGLGNMGVLRWRLGEMKTALANFQRAYDLYVTLDDQQEALQPLLLCEGEMVTAKVTYALWPVDGDEGLRETAVTLYTELFKQMPNLQMKMRLATLQEA